jgi:DNA-binding NarL/FixJ family response regulator
MTMASDLYTVCLDDDAIWVEIQRRTGVTPARLAVLRCACRGLHTKDIATELGVTDKTVHAHKSDLYPALEVHCIEAAIRKVMALAVGIYRERHGETQT